MLIDACATLDGWVGDEDGCGGSGRCGVRAPLNARAVQRDKKLLQGVMASEKDRLHLKRTFVPGSDVNLKRTFVPGSDVDNDRMHGRIVSSVCGGGSRKRKYGEGETLRC